MSDIGRAWWRSTNPANAGATTAAEVRVLAAADVIQEAVRQAKALRDQGWSPQAVVLGPDEFELLREATLRPGATGTALASRLAGLKVVVEQGATGVTVLGNAPLSRDVKEAVGKARRSQDRREKALLTKILKDLEERLAKARGRSRRPVAIQVSSDVADLFGRSVELEAWDEGEDGPTPPDCLGKLYGLPVILSMAYDGGAITALGVDVQSMPQPTRQDPLGIGDDDPPLGRPAVPMTSLRPDQERVIREIEGQELALSRVGIKPSELWLSREDWDTLNDIPGILIEYVSDGILFKGMRITVKGMSQRPGESAGPVVRGPKGERTSTVQELEAELDDDPVWTDV